MNFWLLVRVRGFFFKFKEELKKYKILEDISKLPDVGEYSINKSNVLTMNMDEKHKSELTEYGKNINMNKQ